MEQYDSPEIQRADLSMTVLYMAKLAIAEPATFPFMQMPGATYFAKAIKDLRAWDAIGEDLAITDHGTKA